jgi:glycosyltransferase involved in cell wall biosynthesis
LYVPKKNRLCYVNQLAKEVLFYELPPVISHVSYLLESLEYQTYRHTQFLCYSDSVKKDLRDFGIHSENVSTFPIGIDHARYIPGKKSKDPLFVFVARLTPMKRPDLCIEAMRIVIRTYPKAKLALVGYGPMEGPLERMIHAYALEQSVFLVNKDALFFHVTPKDKKVTLMQQAWALVLPSVKEGWGLVVTEAGACQTPAIVTNVTGLRDSVLPDTTGIFLSANPSAHELARAMIHIIEDASYRKKLSVGARTYSLTFTWDTSYDKFYEAITV